MELVFIVVKRYCKFLGYDFIILEVKVICYENMLLNDLYKEE